MLTSTAPDVHSPGTSDPRPVGVGAERAGSNSLAAAGTYFHAAERGSSVFMERIAMIEVAVDFHHKF